MLRVKGGKERSSILMKELYLPAVLFSSAEGGTSKHERVD